MSPISTVMGGGGVCSVTPMSGNRVGSRTVGAAARPDPAASRCAAAGAGRWRMFRSGRQRRRQVSADVSASGCNVLRDHAA